MALTIVGRTSLEMRDAQLGVYIFISLSLSLSFFPFSLKPNRIIQGRLRNDRDARGIGRKA